jgi:hypothetical protein
MNIVGHQFTWFNGDERNSSIDLIIVKGKLRNYRNIAYICNSFITISVTLYHLFFLVKKKSPDGFIKSTFLERKLNGLIKFRRINMKQFFSHNKSLCFQDEFEHNDNPESNILAKKLLCNSQ